jgi:small-conductance mechanosensitive channel
MVDVTSFFGMATYITILVEFALGFGFGYFLGKFVKALLGLIVMGFIGVALNFTQFIALSNTVLKELGVSQSQFITIASTILLFLGLTVIAPLTVGLIIGLLVGR